MRERREKSKINIDIAKWFCFDEKINGSNVLEIRLYYHYIIREKTNEKKEKRGIESFKEILEARSRSI